MIFLCSCFFTVVNMTHKCAHVHTPDRVYIRVGAETVSSHLKPHWKVREGKKRVLP